ncbi:MAG: DNA polymerase III subunit delta [Chitinophagales bacterium]|nr:DNA polymerase III subunit delta [Bacteroidota bacterium]MCB9043736.1 DNA polymerase III subunit delta [Chitinophagales bacterium]
MAVSFAQIMQQLQAKQYLPVYFLAGEEAFFIDKISGYIAQNVLNESEQAFNLMIFYGRELESQQLLTTLRRFPMMAPYQVIIVKEAQTLTQSDALLAYYENPVPHTILVMEQHQKAHPTTHKLRKAVESKGCYFESKPIYENQLPDWLVQYVKEKSFSIDHAAVSMLCNNIGTDLNVLENELNKLFLNAAETKNIDAELVEKYTGISREYNFFEMQRAMAYGQWEKVMHIANFFAANPKSMPIPLFIANLFSFFSRLLVYQQNRQQNDSRLLELMEMKPSQKFALGEFRQAASVFSSQRIERILRYLLKYDAQSKGVETGAKNDADIIKELVFYISL